MAAIDTAVRREQLVEYFHELKDCQKCVLAGGRTQVVFGMGNADADLMFVGEAPGFHEDQQGIPFVGQAGKLLDRLLGGIGLTRADVYVANTLKCRPPGNRDPMPEEKHECEPWLFRQIALIQPKLIATLGNVVSLLLFVALLGETATVFVADRMPEIPHLRLLVLVTTMIGLGVGLARAGFTVNGIDNKDNTVGGPVMQLPLEAVQEFQHVSEELPIVTVAGNGGRVGNGTPALVQQFVGRGADGAKGHAGAVLSSDQAVHRQR